MAATPSSLRSHLSEALKSLPGSSQLFLYTFITPARKHGGLFPHTSLPQSSPHRSKILQQEILILVSQSGTTEEKPPQPPAFVSGIEAVLYTIPCNSASLLYVSKVDSTGQSVPGSSSPTAPLVKAFVAYFLSPATRPSRNVRVQLFARAQNQYLFPDSSLHPGKRVLTDVKLCRWWKDVLTTVLRDQLQGQGAGASQDGTQYRCHYLFPGLSQAEADRMLNYASVAPMPQTEDAPTWTYSHPYSNAQSPLFSALTFPPDDTTTPDIFDLIPTFSDDPKARFLAELAATSYRHEAAATDGGDGPPSKKRLKSEQPPSLPDGAGDSSAFPATRIKKASITPEEFWERMGFRQECTLNAVTGFFVVDHNHHHHHHRHLLPPDPSPPPPSADVGTIPTAMLARISSSLQNLDFGSTERAVEATKVLTESIGGLCAGLGCGGGGGDEEGDFYGRHVVASLIVRNPPPRAANAMLENGAAPGVGDGSPVTGTAPAPVNVLQVRKKKRPAGAG